MHKAPDFRTVDNRLQARLSEFFFRKAAYSHRPDLLNGLAHRCLASEGPRRSSPRETGNQFLEFHQVASRQGQVVECDPWVSPFGLVNDQCLTSHRRASGEKCLQVAQQHQPPHHPVCNMESGIP